MNSELLRAKIHRTHLADEKEHVAYLKSLVYADAQQSQSIVEIARKLVRQVRTTKQSKMGIDAFLQEYSLDSQEGVVLMCLAEALLRIPDTETAEGLIRQKLSTADWDAHLGKSSSWLVNASTWGLLLTGKTVKPKAYGQASNFIRRLLAESSEPLIRRAILQAMKIMAKQFVLGVNIEDALKRGKKDVEKGYVHSFDMLGEVALTAEDALFYKRSYIKAIQAVGKEQKVQSTAGTGTRSPASISIKLSALHPRYQYAQQERVLRELGGTLLELLSLARKLDVAITLDAEEAEQLEVYLQLFEQCLRHEVCRGWNQFGLVVQAYSKQAMAVLHWLAALGSELNCTLPVRLVKGAYWDSEIKQAQQLGLKGYPVFTRKVNTDISYLACARFLLEAGSAFYPQFGTHNAHTVAAILTFAGKLREKPGSFEFQRLHGMGEALYQQVLAQDPQIKCRIYAPVGQHKDLLPYLIRRLLENGANTSFVHRLLDEKTPVNQLVHDPIAKLDAYPQIENTAIPLPKNIYGAERINALGYNIQMAPDYHQLQNQIQPFLNVLWHAMPIVDGKRHDSNACCPCFNPYNPKQQIGTVVDSSRTLAESALKSAHQALPKWKKSPVEQRAQLLEKTADLLEHRLGEFIALCVREAGKTLSDALDECREAIDFCRYYAVSARKEFAQPQLLHGPTGESNELYWQGRGVFACISPWNFPLAIFTGQVAAALVAGNTVLAKPAEQSSLTAYAMVKLFHQAGVPGNVLQFLPGEGPKLGTLFCENELIKGIVFTGSTETAKLINRGLSTRRGAITPLIAETGGLNAMLVDSSALPEQVVRDVIQSAFGSAGQRCSSMRILFLQDEIAERILTLLAGAMAQLCLGDPFKLNTDIGPVIDQQAMDRLNQHKIHMQTEAKCIYECPAFNDPSSEEQGFFVSPAVYELSSLAQLDQEHFGPILHILRYTAADLDQVLDDINGLGYGLTLGIHSRNEGTAAYIEQRVNVGNTYINRNMIGAVVGVQPFGGQGLSGTGPKAGGPHYLHRFATERTRTINTAAVGGNASLLALTEDQNYVSGIGSHVSNTE